MSQDVDESDALTLPLAQAAWMEPVWLHSPAPWAGHIPFAAWLVAATRPRTLVELGVYSGISYLSFCEAAVRYQVPLRAWGVDTWAGDPHAGHYDGEVLHALRARHDPRYAGFSTLLQKTFDAALDDIPDGSVDVLHIDGLHTYEAVRHDFETWQPKLSERAVVLFHDIEVRQGDFGVWRYWAELAGQHPSFSFSHSNGLGVLLAGRDAPPVLRELSADARQLHAARHYFGALGERFELRVQTQHQASLVQDTQAQAQRDAEAVKTQDAWIRQQDQKLLEAERQQARLQNLLEEQSREWPARIAQVTDQAQQYLQASRVAQAATETLQQRTEELLRNQAARMAELQARMQRDATMLADQASEMEEMRARMQRDAAALATQDAWIREQDQKLLEAGRQQTRALASWDEERKTQIERMTQVTRQARQSMQALSAAHALIQSLRQQLDGMLVSRSWRVTSGLRKMGDWARQARQSPAGTRAIVPLRRARKVLRYGLRGDWRGLWEHVRHFRQQASEQASEARRLEQFRDKAVTCGILCTPHTLYVAHALQIALERAGIQAAVVAEAQDYPLDLYFVVCPQMFKLLPPGEKRIAFQMEQTVSSRWLTPDYLALLENSLAMLDYSQTNLTHLAEMGIAYPHVYLVPIGGVQDYRVWLGDAAADASAEASCDVLFYGDAHAPRRQRLLAEIGRHYTVRVVGDTFGAEMRRALAGARVVVNLHYYEGALLETTRIFECLSLGKSVVSERAADQAEHRLLESAVRFADVDDAPGLIAAIGEALAEQNDAARRADHAARCDAVVRTSQARFDFMLYRLLLSRRVLSYAQFEQLTSQAQLMSQLTPRLALSLPETVARSQAFEAIRPDDVSVFDGLRYSPGWMGCALSYKYLAQTALRQGLTRLEIMEDDVGFPVAYPERWSAVQAYLDAHVGEWDVFAGLMADVHPDTRVIEVEQVGGETFVTLDRMVSTVCNVYSAKALQLMAQWDETNTDAQTNTIDRFIQRQTRLRAVVVLPFLVDHHEDLHSSLWGFSNGQYAHMIADAQTRLWRMAEQAMRRGGGKDNAEGAPTPASVAHGQSGNQC